MEKRNHQPDTYWELIFQRNNQRYSFSCKTASLRHAEVEAKFHIDQFNAGRLQPRPPSAPKCATFGDLFAVVQSLDMIADATGRKTYVWGARKCFSFALGIAETAVDALPLSLVNADTGAQFFTRALAHAGSLVKQSDQNKFKRQAAAWFNASKALFAPDPMRSVPTLGLPALSAEALAGWRKAKPKRFKVPKASEFIPPGNTVLRATFRQWIKLGAVQRHPHYTVPGGAGNSRKKHEPQPLNPIARRNMFIAIGLMLACGLRKNEVAQIKWRHLTTDSRHQPRLVARDVTVKNQTALIEVKPLNPFWQILIKTIARHGWQGSPDDYVLAQRAKTPGSSADSPHLIFSHGGHCDRTYWPFYHTGKWLRSLGWHLQKTNHALRDCAASYVTMKFGLLRAKKFCRHEQLQTTESHYNKFVDEDLMDDPNRLRWLRWAK